EHQDEDDRHDGDVGERLRLPPDAGEAALGQHPQVGDEVRQIAAPVRDVLLRYELGRDGGHAASLPSSSSLVSSAGALMWPVGARNTSSSEARCMVTSLTWTPVWSSARTTRVVSPSAGVTGAVNRLPLSSGWTLPMANGLTATIAASTSAPAARTTSRCSPPTEDLSWSGVPSAMTAPPSITATRRASWSASSRYCVVSSSVVPESASSRTISHVMARAFGSRPVVGSSRNSTDG